MRARRVVSRAIPLSRMSLNRNEHVCPRVFASMLDQRVITRKRCCCGEKSRGFAGGFAASYEMICENRMLLVYFTHWAWRCVAGPSRIRTWHCGAEASPSLGPQCIIYHTSHSFDDESWSPGDYMDVSFVYDLQCVAAKRGPWEHGWWILGGV